MADRAADAVLRQRVDVRERAVRIREMREDCGLAAVRVGDLLRRRKMARGAFVLDIPGARRVVHRLAADAGEHVRVAAALAIMVPRHEAPIETSSPLEVTRLLWQATHSLDGANIGPSGGLRPACAEPGLAAARR